MKKITTLPPKERLILGLLLEHGPSYGLELVRRSGGKLKRGTVYVLLQRLSEKRYVASYSIAHGVDGFRITPAGQRAMDAWAQLEEALV